jgi:hypothetical protein
MEKKFDVAGEGIQSITSSQAGLPRHPLSLYDADDPKL